MTKITSTSGEINHVYARDRATVVATAILAVVKDWLDDPELRGRLAESLRFEFADIMREVFENRPTD